MKFILISSKYPGESDTEILKSWSGAVNKIREIAGREPKIQMLGKGAWLIPEGNGLSFLGEAAHVLKEWGIQYQMILVEQATDWIAKDS